MILTEDEKKFFTFSINERFPHLEDGNSIEQYKKATNRELIDLILKYAHMNPHRVLMFGDQGTYWYVKSAPRELLLKFIQIIQYSANRWEADRDALIELTSSRTVDAQDAAFC